MVGQKLDENWSEFDKGLVPIKDRIKRIYEIKNKEIDFGKGVWQKVLKLFKTRVSLVHPKYVKVTRENEAPDLFQEIQQKYTVTQIKQIIETAIDTLLSETGLDNLKDVYHMRFYSGPPRE